MAPGASTFTLMRRGAKSMIQPRAKLRMTALLGLYTLKAGAPVTAAVEPFGLTLAAALMPLCEWGNEHRANIAHLISSPPPVGGQTGEDAVEQGP